MPPQFTSKLDGNALVVSFPGQERPVDWELEFANR